MENAFSEWNIYGILMEGKCCGKYLQYLRNMDSDRNDL